MKRARAVLGLIASAIILLSSAAHWLLGSRQLAGSVVAVCLGAAHRLHKTSQARVLLRAGLGLDGDAHQGATVQHRSRVALDPTRPNLRQVHLIHAELHDELRAAGFAVAAGVM